MNVKASTTKTMAMPGGRMYHQAGRWRRPSPGVVEHGAPAEVERVAQTEERELGLGGDRFGHHEDRVGEDQREDVGQDVLVHDVHVARADGLGRAR
jgi:hypothetical protein